MECLFGDKKNCAFVYLANCGGFRDMGLVEMCEFYQIIMEVNSFYV